MIYLDHNATTPIAPEALEATCPPKAWRRRVNLISPRNGEAESAGRCDAVFATIRPQHTSRVRRDAEGHGRQLPEYEKKMLPLRDALENGILSSMLITQFNNQS